MAKPTAVVGTRAPDFALPCTSGAGASAQRVSLADYQNRWLVMLFYPRDFSLVCPTELIALSTRLAEFHERDSDVLGISTDSIASHERWIATPRAEGGLAGLRFPLASDEDGSVCQAYSVYVSRVHLALRGLFIVDPNGVLQYMVVHNLSVGRRTDEVLRVLDALQSGGLCAEGWTPEQPNLDPRATLGPGSVIGQYHIEALLGSGSFGTVFRALDLVLQRTVALKVIGSTGSAPADALLNEARTAAALNHPNVCTVFAVDASQGAPMIVMEYVDGQPLSKLLEASRVPEPQVASIGRQIALGMATAHAQGIVHGDLKPANLMIGTEGTVKIMDFGLARQTPRLTADADTVLWMPQPSTGLSGTPRYMSPEQVRNQPVTAASDVFALGLILYEMLTGETAIQGNSLMEVLRQIDLVDAPYYAARLPDPFAAIVRQALIGETANRTLTMNEIAERLG